MGFGGLNIASSGMRAAQVNLAVTGHNISNSEIPGYSRQRIVQTTAFTRTIGINRAQERMVVGMGTDWTNVHQIRNEFLDISYRQNVGRLSFYSTVVQTGLVVESLLGELHGAYNFQSVLNDMWSSIQELTANPAGIDTRQLFLATANSLLNKAQDVMTGLIDYQYNLDAQIRAMVAEINHTAQEINRLNHLIRSEEGAGDKANDFRDERNRLVDRMAEMIPIDVFSAPDGDVIIISQGHTIVSQGFVNTMGLRFTSNEFSFVEPVFTRSQEILSAGTPPDQFTAFTNYRRAINNANNNDFGQLNALLMARGVVPANHTTADILPPSERVDLLQQIVDNLEAARDNAQDLVDSLVADGLAGTPAYLSAQAALERAELALLGAENRRDQWITAWNDPVTGYDFRAAEYHNWNAMMWSLNHAKIPRVQQNLDRIVNSVATMINDAFTGNLRRVDPTGAEYYVFPLTDADGNLVLDANGNPQPMRPLDKEGNLGIPLFIRRTDPEGVAWPFPDVDPTRIATVFTINNLQINPAFLELDGHDFLALSLSGAPDDNRLTLALQEIWLSNTGPYAVNIGGRYFGVQDAYIRFTGDIATQIHEANNRVAAGTIQVQQADHLRQSVKGVSMDEELNHMLRFQFAFQSASRVFNVIDGMIDQIVNRTGRVGL